MKHIKTLAFGTLLATANLAMAQGDCAVNATLDIVAPACTEGATGSVTINATGGVEPYNYWINGNATTQTTTGLVAGYYDYWVEDAVHCWFKADFTLECEPEENCEFRTQTQGGWGANPNGNNPATYLQNHFASCFPNGVTIGCSTNNTLTLTSSTAVKNFLPSGSTASQLPNDLVNPGGSYSNVLAGQLVAAVINVTVDACDPDFSAASGWSGDLTYVGGTFAGWTVSEVIDAANQFIGGCGGSYTAAQFNDALSMFNENYVGGTIDNGNFSCKKSDKKIFVPQNAGMGMYPNPASTEVNVRVELNNAGEGTLVVRDLMGRMVLTQNVAADAAGVRLINLDLNNLTNGTYTVSLEFGGAIRTERIVVAK